MPDDAVLGPLPDLPADLWNSLLGVALTSESVEGLDDLVPDAAFEPVSPPPPVWDEPDDDIDVPAIDLDHHPFPIGPDDDWH